MTKSAVSCGFGRIYLRTPTWKISFSCREQKVPPKTTQTTPAACCCKISLLFAFVTLAFFFLFSNIVSFFYKFVQRTFFAPIRPTSQLNAAGIQAAFFTSRLIRRSRSQIFLKIDFLKNFEIFTEKHVCWCLF